MDHDECIRGQKTLGAGTKHETVITKHKKLIYSTNRPTQQNYNPLFIFFTSKN